jgi:hypothetical protein
MTGWILPEQIMESSHPFAEGPPEEALYYINFYEQDNIVPLNVNSFHSKGKTPPSSRHLNSAPATTENWHLKDHMQKVNI